MSQTEQTAPSTDTFYQTMKLTFEQICQGEREWTALGNFMNHWYSYHVDERERLISEPLPEAYLPAFHQWAVFCAASVEWFCHTYHVPCPDWPNDPLYTLDEPWFFYPTGHNKLLRTTPPEFAQRNIYCGPRIYANKWEFMDEIWERYGDRLRAMGKKPDDDLFPTPKAYLQTGKR